jgi:hypothetical protein
MHGACSTYRTNKKYIQNLVAKFGGKRPLGRISHRWEDNIKMDLREIGWEIVN